MRLFLFALLVLAACAEAPDAPPAETPAEPVALEPAALTPDSAAMGALDAGDRAPDFTLPDAVGGTVQLSELLLDGPVVLTFYRGAWCPYCNTQLRDYQQALGDVQSEGASLVAVSPQAPDSSMSTAEKNDLAFAVLSDVGNRVSRDYGLVFRVDDQTKERYASVGLDLTQYNDTDDWELPIPATYVIDQSGTIRAAFVEADYTQRASTRDILSALRDLT